MKSNLFFSIALVILAGALVLDSCSSGADLARTPGPSLDDPNALLPVAPELSRSLLPNGITYYLRQNGNPAGRVVFHLAIASGSSSERDDERGYAHFVEHMAFNGTAKYPENKLVEYLRSIGMEFGAEVNASTSRESTIFSLELPTDNPEYIATGLEVLREWANAITFDPAEVEKEKGVILEEMRRGYGPASLASENELDIMLAGTAQAGKNPIGTDASIRNATADRLKSFYERTFRPEAMSVIAVGDIDPESLGEMIKDNFSFTPRDGLKSERSRFPVPPSSGYSFRASIHADFDQSVVFLQRLVAHNPERTIGDYETMVLKRLAINAIQTRLADLARTTDIPWQSANCSEDYFYGGTKAFGFYLQTAPGSELVSFSRFMEEAEKINRYGFTKSELKRTTDDWRQFIKSLDVEDSDVGSYSFAEEYVRNFLYGEPIPGIVNERPLQLAILDRLTLDRLNSVSRELLSDYSGFIGIRAKGTPSSSDLSKESFIAAITAAKNATLQRVEESPFSGNLFETLPLPGKIVSERKLESDITEFRLSNGARVLAKKTSFDRGKIELFAIAPGGLASIPVPDLTPVQLLSTLSGSSGLGTFSAREFDELTTGIDVGLEWNVTDSYRLFSGSAAPETLDTLLRIVYLASTSPGTDKNGFERTKRLIADNIRQALGEDGYRFETAFNGLLYSGSKRKAALDPVSVDGLSIEAVSALQRRYYGDPAEFTWIFSGDFDYAALKKSLEQHLASIPSAPFPHIEKTDPAIISTTAIRKNFPLAKENRSSVRILFAGKTEWTNAKANALQLLGLGLQNRLLDLVREDLGGAYTLSAGGSLDRHPESQYVFHISFDTDPEKAQAIVKAIEDEIRSIREKGLNEKYVAQVKAMISRSLESQMDTNRFWTGRIANSILNGLSLDIPTQATELLDLVTQETMDTAVKEFLDFGREFVFVMNPGKGLK